MTGRRPRRAGSLRPTARRVRVALFDRLGARVIDAEVLDLYAGTGALGLEALQRGARAAVFVERDARLAQEIRERLNALGLRERGEVWRATVTTALRRLGAEGRRFDLVLLDPPYGRGLLQETLDALARAGVVRRGGAVVAEGHWRDRASTPPGWDLVRAARYGETGLWEYSVAKEAGRDDGDLSGNI